jgi:putative nucleotidyltransferase with HDIG domain
MRISTRLILLFLACGLLPLGITLLVLAPNAEDSLRTSAKLLHESQLESLRARIDGTFDDLLSDVRWLATQPATDRAGALKQLISKHADLTAVTLSSGGARVTGGQAFDRSLVDAHSLERHEQEALAGGGPGLRLSPCYSARRKPEMRVTLSVPFPPAGPEGRLAAEVGLDRVQEMVAGARIGRRGQAFLVDERGQLVAHRNRDAVRARKDMSGIAVVAQLKENMKRAMATGRELMVVRDFDDGGVPQVGAFAPLHALRWGLVTEEPREDAYGLARAAFAYAAGWAALALALLCVVAVVFARNITRPIERLIGGTKSLARGEFGKTLPLEGPPELRELFRVFNEASQRLARYDHENLELLARVERSYLETLRALVNAIEAKDTYTAGHSQRTAEVAVAIARSMALPDEQLMEIEFGGLLHDIGKIGIPEQILRKPGPLSDEEMDIMRKHPNIGGMMTDGVPFLQRINAMIRNHHERYDGSGYPDKLVGEAIPVGARIVAVADTYDALTSDRPYQPGRSPAEALIVIKRLSGTTLDTKVVVALEQALSDLGLYVDTPPPAGGPPLKPASDLTGNVNLPEKR